MRSHTLPFAYDAFYPQGWDVRQERDIASFLDREGERVWIAKEGGALAGFVGLRLHPEDRMGEIYVMAVDPDNQRKGIARALMDQAEAVIRGAGMRMVMVETGGDPGHGPARQTYEAAGYERWPVARYFKKL